MMSTPHHTSSAKRGRIGIVCLSAIPDDPRVRRQGDLLTQMGWDVVAIGLPGAKSAPPEWVFIPVIDHANQKDNREHNDKNRNSSMGVIGVAKKQLRRVRRAFDIMFIALNKSYAKSVYWRLNRNFKQIYLVASQHKVDIWLANDWSMLPIVHRLSAEQSVPYGYDTHELAVGEYSQSWLWRLTQLPVILNVESHGIKNAAFVTCVSAGIADKLAEMYDLAEKPIVIRNTPIYSQPAPRPLGETIEVLYHGMVAEGRGLEACIQSVKLWRPEFRLTIRGPSSESYLSKLQSVAANADVSHRVVFDESVPMTELVDRAAAFDVGLFALPGNSLQNVYVLPNKFFEYTMAGLALCVSDLPEMAHLLRRHELGELISAVSPEAIAQAVNRLERASIEQFRKNALVAAKELNWQNDGQKLVVACKATLDKRALASLSPQH
jgi:glycosyltransferase involved in cell wall biosynthesis